MQVIVVLLKQTLDTEEKLSVTDAGILEVNDGKRIINPYDEFALEEAVHQKELYGSNVIAVTCGDDQADEALRTALAIGADEAIRLTCDNDMLVADSYLLAAALAELIAPLKPDLILAGLYAIDSGAGSVALQVAERLQLPHIAAAIKLDIVPAAEVTLQALPTATLYAIVEQDVEGDTVQVTAPLPVLITAQQGLNEPRYPSLPNIMRAKRKPLQVVKSEPNDTVITTKQVALIQKPTRAACQQLSGTAPEQVAALIQVLQTKGVL